MILSPGWADISLRLLCAFIACCVVGLDREWQERAAGMRTTVLVGMAACFAAVSTNLLLGTTGKESGGFAQIDVMRLPLGILTGIGFIGAGAIIRRDGLVHGVTTAATLWFVTVMGLCFGLGQLSLGGAAFVISLFVLGGLKRLEGHLNRQKEASLAITLGREGPGEAAIKALITGSNARVRRMFVRYEPAAGRREYRFQLWAEASNLGTAPAFIAVLREMPGVEQVDWEM